MPAEEDKALHCVQVHDLRAKSPLRRLLIRIKVEDARVIGERLIGLGGFLRRFGSSARLPDKNSVGYSAESTSHPFLTSLAFHIALGLVSRLKPSGANFCHPS